MKSFENIKTYKSWIVTNMMMIFTGGVKVVILDDILFDKKEEIFSINRPSRKDAFFL
jgi:hypothetical protein